MDVETAWPNYVAEYEAAGAAELETMVNEAIATARAAALNFIRHCPQQPRPFGAQHRSPGMTGFRSKQKNMRRAPAEQTDSGGYEYATGKAVRSFRPRQGRGV